MHGVQMRIKDRGVQHGEEEQHKLEVEEENLNLTSDNYM